MVHLSSACARYQVPLYTSGGPPSHMGHGWDSSDYDYSCLRSPQEFQGDFFSVSFYEDVLMFGFLLIMLTRHIYSSGIPLNWVFTSRDFPQSFGVLGHWNTLGDLEMTGDAS